jgi:S-adenosylmethionine:tRNA ribosyltransferase-isomerase
MKVEEIQIEQYDYNLPEQRIARYPLASRDASKILLYQNGDISHKQFLMIVDELQAGDVLISNNTRVIAARLFFKKKTGASIEIFCLEPVGTSHQDAMLLHSKSVWKCLVGGAKKWKGDETLECSFLFEGQETIVYATRIEQTADAFVIEFNWDNKRLTFSEILRSAGELPLPPYFNRQVESEDYNRYQTVFAQHDGSVAAPTAGLHFTPSVIEALQGKGVVSAHVTLHVGAGTFKPVSSETMEGHTMHSESFSVDKTLIERILKAQGRIVPIGTTSMRTLESLYWLGVKMKLNKLGNQLHIGQWDPYQLHDTVSMKDSFETLIDYCNTNHLERIDASTSILIAPGYDFKVCDGIVTNFHMPKSTLLLLVSAFIGDDWKRVYDYALNNDFRFLSYGDSSLLWRTVKSMN